MSNYFVIIFLSPNLCFLTFFVRNYQSILPWANELTVSTNMTRGNGPIHL